MIFLSKRKEKIMEHKHIAEEIHFDLKELFEICAKVIYEAREGEDVRGVLRVAKALIMHTSYADGNHFVEEDRLYDLAGEYLGDFTKTMASSNYSILMMLNIKRVLQLSFFVCNAKRRQSHAFVRPGAKKERRPKPFR